MSESIPLAIELGDLSIRSATSLADIGWFLIGLLILLTVTAVTLWWHRRGHTDPFLIDT